MYHAHIFCVCVTFVLPLFHVVLPLLLFVSSKNTPGGYQGDHNANSNAHNFVRATCREKNHLQEPASLLPPPQQKKERMKGLKKQKLLATAKKSHSFGAFKSASSSRSGSWQHHQCTIETGTISSILAGL